MSQPLLTRMTLIILVLAAFLGLSPATYSDNSLGSIAISVSSLNVRGGPGLDHEIIGSVQQKETYPVLSKKDNWMQIPLKNGQKGWVASWLVESKREGSDPSSYVTPVIDTMNVRSGPSTSFPVIEQISKAEKYQKLEANGDWMKIKLKNGETGWTASWLLKIAKEGPQNEQAKAPSPAKKQAVVTVPLLNVRSGPDTVHELIGQLHSGESLEILDTQGDWLKISHDGGITGWVASWLVAADLQAPTGKEQKSPTDEAYVKIINPGTNLRSGPGTSHEVVEIAKQGDTFPVLQAEGDWFHIRLPGDRSAYVAGWIVSAHGVPNVDRKGIEKMLAGKTILIDPGHGGNDSGAIGAHLGSLEKSMNLQVSKMLASKLKAAGASILMTRSDDRKVSLQERVNMSVDHQVDAFISIHHNTSESYQTNGIITYFYSNGNDRELAGKIQKELIKQTNLTDLKARYGDYFVLRENPQLAVLCELGFITNYQEELILNTKEYQGQAAEGIFQGILKYFHEQES